MAREKTLEEMTMEEIDAIIGPATEAAVRDNLAAGIPVIYGDEEATYRRWPNGQIELLAKSDVVP